MGLPPNLQQEGELLPNHDCLLVFRLLSMVWKFRSLLLHGRRTRHRRSQHFHWQGQCQPRILLFPVLLGCHRSSFCRKDRSSEDDAVRLLWHRGCLDLHDCCRWHPVFVPGLGKRQGRRRGLQQRQCWQCRARIHLHLWRRLLIQHHSSAVFVPGRVLQLRDSSQGHGSPELRCQCRRAHEPIRLADCAQADRMEDIHHFHRLVCSSGCHRLLRLP